MRRGGSGNNAPAPCIAFQTAFASEKIPVAGTIAWITPRGAQGNQAAGIGVHFSEGDGGANVVRGKIENHLVDKLKSDKATYTM